MEYKQRIEKIAIEYHQASLEPDMFIENSVQQYEADWVLKRAPKGARFLELGVGDGVTIRHLSPHFTYEIVEGASMLVDTAKRLSSESKRDFRVHHSWFEEFQPDEQFDFVYASHVLEHVERPIDLLQRMKTWLKPSGELIVIVPNSESIHRRVGVELGVQAKLESLSPRDLKVGHLRVYSLETLKQDMLAGGFEPVFERGFFVKPLANSQLTHLSGQIVKALCSVSDSMDARMCANLCIVAKVV